MLVRSCTVLPTNMFVYHVSRTGMYIYNQGHNPIHKCMQTNNMGWLRLVGSIKIKGLFCKRALSKRRYSAKETYNFIDPTDRSDPISMRIRTVVYTLHMCVCVSVVYTLHMCVCVCILHTCMQPNLYECIHTGMQPNRDMSLTHRRSTHL